MNFKAYGKDNLLNAIEGSILVMNHLSKLIYKSNDFELIANGLSIVCFRYIGNYDADNIEQINNLNLKIVKIGRR